MQESTPGPEKTGPKNTGDFLIIHVNTILGVGVIFNGLLLAVFLPLLRNAGEAAEVIGGIDYTPVLFQVALFFRHLWFLGYVFAAAEILLWIFARGKLYLIYINTLILIISSSISAFCFLMVFGPFFRIGSMIGIH
jgi:hypothetical protein